MLDPQATPYRAAIEALTEVRARVYSCTSIMPDGERVILQTTMLKIIENVLKEYER